MSKKVVDIFPPQEETKERKSFFQENNSQPPKKSVSKGWGKKKLFIGFAVLVLFIIALFSFKFSTAEIKIWPNTETVSFKGIELTVETTLKNLNLDKKIIPGKVFQAEKIISDEFSSSGRPSKKAEGVIRLYNAYTTKSEIWRKNTRFVSSEGKLFLSKDKIYVPGANIKNGKIVPSSVDVPVIAAQPGSDYNIGPSHFSVVVYRGTPRYTKFYGESFSPMSGGGEVPEVTKQDLESAESTLIEKARVELNKELEKEIPDTFIFLKDVSNVEILDKSSSAQEGVAVEKFNFQVRARVKTITFKKEDLNKFAEYFFLSQIPQTHSIYENGLRLDYHKNNVDFDSGKLSLLLNLKTDIFPKIDIVNLKKSIVKKTDNETKIFLENQPQIKNVDIHFFPPWMRYIPDDIGRIKIDYPIIP